MFENCHVTESINTKVQFVFVFFYKHVKKYHNNKQLHPTFKINISSCSVLFFYKTINIKVTKCLFGYGLQMYIKLNK